MVLILASSLIFQMLILLFFLIVYIISVCIRSLVLVMAEVGIVSNAAFTSSSRLLEGTSLGLSNQTRGFQMSILFIIINLRSSALTLSLHGLVVTRAWYPISDVGDDDDIY